VVDPGSDGPWEWQTLGLEGVTILLLCGLCAYEGPPRHLVQGGREDIRYNGGGKICICGRNIFPVTRLTQSPPRRLT